MPSQIESFEHESVSNTKQELSRISHQMMKIHMCINDMVRIPTKVVSRGFVADDYQIKTTGVRRLERQIDRIVAEHQIKCPHCEQVNELSRWKLKRGHRDEEALVAGCPGCQRDWIFDGSYGADIKTILCRAYAPLEEIFGRVVA